MFLQSFYKISLVVFFFDYTDDLYCSLDIIFALEAGSSWRTIKMSMPDNSDLRQIIMAFCMVRNPIFSQNLIIAFKVSFLFSSMSLVWSFSTVVPWLIGRGYVKANCSLVGVSGVSSRCQNDTLLTDALLRGPQPYSPLQSPGRGPCMKRCVTVQTLLVWTLKSV